jgi:hypothetical protein
VGDLDLTGRVEDALAWRSDRTAQQYAGVGSNTPELVEQEFWGLLMARFAIRGLLNEAALREILEERVVASRNRIHFRGVKRKMSNYSLRPRERQPTRRVDVSKQIRIVK